MTAKPKKQRTILCLGPPHSGKSVFCYILFKFLRRLGDDACLMDADYYSPTIRRFRMEEFADSDELRHIIVTPNAEKLTALTEEIFSQVAHGIHAMIEETGIIVVDGIGKQSRSTDSLLELADMLIILCSSAFEVEKHSEACGYTGDKGKLHPFDLYGKRSKKCIKITTHYKSIKKAHFDENGLEAELFELERTAIKTGNIDGIPKETKDVILQIAQFIINNWI